MEQETSRKRKIAVTCIMIVIYAVMLLAGILLLSVPSLSSLLSGMGICNEISARAYAITIGTMWLALVPSLGLYFATLSPFGTKVVKIIIGCVSIAFLVASTAVFFIVADRIEVGGIAVKDYFEGSDSWFIYVSVVFAAAGIIICYLLTLFRINPEKSGFKFLSAVLKYKDKHTDIFILLSTLLLTWFAFFTAFVFAIICIAVLLGVFIMCFAGLIRISYECSSTENKNKKIEISDGGRYKTLTHNPYRSGENGEQVYEGDYGETWYSSDGGKTVHK